VDFKASTNQVVVFTPTLDGNGMPVVKAFPATSSAVMKHYFETESIATEVYVIIAQPLHTGASSFTLCFFGSNKFTAEDILKRWSFLEDQAEKHNIQVQGFSSDGDPRLMKAMQTRMFQRVEHEWKSWYLAQKTVTSATV